MRGGDYQLRSGSVMRRVAAAPDLADLYGQVIIMDRPTGDEPAELTGIARAAGTCTANGHRISLRRILPAHPISQSTADYLLAIHRDHIRRHASRVQSVSRPSRWAGVDHGPGSAQQIEYEQSELDRARAPYRRFVACLQGFGLDTSDRRCRPSG